LEECCAPAKCSCLHRISSLHEAEPGEKRPKNCHRMPAAVFCKEWTTSPRDCLLLILIRVEARHTERRARRTAGAHHKGKNGGQGAAFIFPSSLECYRHCAAKLSGSSLQSAGASVAQTRAQVLLLFAPGRPSWGVIIA